jgi:hypothetical protein
VLGQGRCVFLLSHDPDPLIHQTECRLAYDEVIADSNRELILSQAFVENWISSI